jgi:carboxyl-terminal processing protease
MIDRLDPHSSYVPPEEVARRRERVRGSFGGVGIRYNVLNDTARVLSPIEDSPSAQAGIRAGDRIVSVEDSTAIGLSNQELRRRLTGPKGTQVRFTVVRPPTGERHTFTIRRAEISLSSIPSFYMIDDQTGYVDVDRFAQPTHDEFVRTITDLKDQGMHRLLLDLRGNQGGVMEAAIDVVDEFLGHPGQEIVRLEGRLPSTNQTRRTQAGGILKDEPVILLVDDRTASASEILAGTLQDHDRALIVGRRTYGKALVQKPYQLNDGSLLNLTVGRYYTPTGRLIQTPFDADDRQDYYATKASNQRTAVHDVRAYKESIPDSLTYRTVHGRTVFGGGGILPDYVVQPDTTTLSGFLRRGELDRFFAFFASEWVGAHERSLRNEWQNRRDAFLASYRIPEDALARFWTYAQRKEVLTLTASSEAVNPSRQVFSQTKTSAVAPLVRAHLRGQVANILFGSGAGQPALNEVDPTVQKALSLWPDSRELASYHTPASGRGDE